MSSTTATRKPSLRWIWILAFVGATAAMLLVASEKVAVIQAVGDPREGYRFTVELLGLELHGSEITNTHELLPTMRYWAYGLVMCFGLGGAVVGGVIGWGIRRLTLGGATSVPAS